MYWIIAWWEISRSIASQDHQPPPPKCDLGEEFRCLPVDPCVETIRVTLPCINQPQRTQLPTVVMVVVLSIVVSILYVTGWWLVQDSNRREMINSPSWHVPVWSWLGENAERLDCLWLLSKRRCDDLYRIDVMLRSAEIGNAGRWEPV